MEQQREANLEFGDTMQAILTLYSQRETLKEELEQLREAIRSHKAAEGYTATAADSVLDTLESRFRGCDRGATRLSEQIVEHLFELSGNYIHFGFRWLYVQTDVFTTLMGCRITVNKLC